MTEQDIINLVGETFDEEISASTTEIETGIGNYLQGEVQGKEQFMQKLAEKLKVLFNENDLSK